MTTTPNLGLIVWDSGNTQPELLYDDLLGIVDALLPTPSVADKDLTAPPSSPVLGALYIVGPSATGGWSGKDNQLVAYTYTNTWRFIPPKNGWIAYLIDEDKQYRFDGSVWNEVSDGGGSTGVTSLNSATGALTLSPGDGIDVSTSGSTLTVRNTGAVSIRAYTTTTDTFVLSDAGKAVHGNNSAAITETIPANADVAFPVGTTILVRQMGAGTITVVAASGVTLDNGYATAKTSGQYRSLALHKIDTNTWVIDGNAAAS